MAYELSSQCLGKNIQALSSEIETTLPQTEDSNSKFKFMLTNTKSN